MKLIRILFGNKINEKGNKNIVKHIDRDNYKKNRSAYNPDYPLTGKTIAVKEVDMYPTARKHLKQVAIVDGDCESIIGYRLSTKKNQTKHKKNEVLNEKKLINGNNGVQYIEKHLVSKELGKEKLYLNDRKNKARKIDKTLKQKEINILKKVSKLEHNKKTSLDYKHKKKE